MVVMLLFGMFTSVLGSEKHDKYLLEVKDLEECRILEDCLYQIGKKAGVRFSIETVYKGNEPHTFLKQRIEWGKLNGGGLESDLNGLEKVSTEALCIFRSNKLKYLFHVEDSDVHKINDYILDKKVDSFKFEGNPVEMLKELSKTYPQLKPKLWSFGKEWNDQFSHIEIDVHNVTIRELLSFAVSDLNYNCIEWIAYTNLDTMETYVTFLGQIKVSDQKELNEEKTSTVIPK